MHRRPPQACADARAHAGAASASRRLPALPHRADAAAARLGVRDRVRARSEPPCPARAGHRDPGIRRVRCRRGRLGDRSRRGHRERRRGCLGRVGSHEGRDPGQGRRRRDHRGGGSDGGAADSHGGHPCDLPSDARRFCVRDSEAGSGAHHLRAQGRPGASRRRCARHRATRTSGHRRRRQSDGDRYGQDTRKARQGWCRQGWCRQGPVRQRRLERQRQGGKGNGQGGGGASGGATHGRSATAPGRSKASGSTGAAGRGDAKGKSATNGHAGGASGAKPSGGGGSRAGAGGAKSNPPGAGSGAAKSPGAGAGSGKAGGKPDGKGTGKP